MKAALEECKEGGRLVIEAGTYLLSPFNVTSNMILYLEENATLLATSDLNKWPLVEALPSYTDNNLRVGAFIGGVNISNTSKQNFKVH